MPQDPSSALTGPCKMHGACLGLMYCYGSRGDQPNDHAASLFQILMQFPSFVSPARCEQTAIMGALVQEGRELGHLNVNEAELVSFLCGSTKSSTICETNKVLPSGYNNKQYIVIKRFYTCHTLLLQRPVV